MDLLEVETQAYQLYAVTNMFNKHFWSILFNPLQASRSAAGHVHAGQHRGSAAGSELFIPGVGGDPGRFGAG